MNEQLKKANRVKDAFFMCITSAVIIGAGFLVLHKHTALALFVMLTSISVAIGDIYKRYEIFTEKESRSFKKIMSSNQLNIIFTMVSCSIGFILFTIDLSSPPEQRGAGVFFGSIWIIATVYFSYSKAVAKVKKKLEADKSIQ